MFGTECMAGQAVSAKSHAIVMSWIEKVAPDPLTAVHAMLNVVFCDTELATQKMTPTILDQESIASRLEPFWAMANRVLPPVDTSVGELDQIIPDGIVRDTMLRTRQQLKWDLIEMHLAGSWMSDQRYMWSSTRCLTDIGRVLNHALAQEASFNQTGNIEEGIHACLALTELYCLKKYLNDAEHNGIDFREAPLIIPHLEAVLRRVMSTSSGTELWRYREALFWIFHTGVWHGQKVRQRRQRHLQREEGFNDTWFGEQLGTQAFVLGLTSWEDAKAVLEKYVFSDMMDPHPANWYEQVVAGGGGSQSSPLKVATTIECSTDWLRPASALEQASPRVVPIFV
jgi:hypothetical protein